MVNTAHHLSHVPEWTIGDRLRKIRRSIGGITQEEMAKLLNVKAVTYSAWESDTNKPRSLVAISKRIEMATGVPAAWVLGLGAPDDDPDKDPTRNRVIHWYPDDVACSPTSRRVLVAA